MSFPISIYPIIIENTDDGATVYGMNFEAGMTIRNQFDLRAGITFQRSLYDDYKSWFETEEPADEAYSRFQNIILRTKRPIFLNSMCVFHTISSYKPIRAYN